jgi:hypothetical protein
MRETTYIPTCDDSAAKGISGFEDDYDDPKYKVRKVNGMGTIREDALEESKYSDGKGSDTAYFSNDEKDGAYDSQEEADFRRRESQLYQGVVDDEDHQPYDDDGGLDEEEEQRRL